MNTGAVEMLVVIEKVLAAAERILAAAEAGTVAVDSVITEAEITVEETAEPVAVLAITEITGILKSDIKLVTP